SRSWSWARPIAIHTASRGTTASSTAATPGSIPAGPRTRARRTGGCSGSISCRGRDRRGLALKSLSRLWRLVELRRKNRDGHVAAESRLARLVDFAHATRAQNRRDLVGTEAGAGLQRHGS